jgi:hypothetical protein
MAIYFGTTQPTTLLSTIKHAIDAGHVETWRYQNSEGKDYFTHTTPDRQWDGKAWLLPRITSGDLTFNIIRPSGGSVSRSVYAVFHGRFIEMMVNHFPDEFTLARATPNAAAGDLV